MMTRRFIKKYQISINDIALKHIVSNVTAILSGVFVWAFVGCMCVCVVWGGAWVWVGVWDGGAGRKSKLVTS